MMLVPTAWMAAAPPRGLSLPPSRAGAARRGGGAPCPTRKTLLRATGGGATGAGTPGGVKDPFSKEGYVGPAGPKPTFDDSGVVDTTLLGLFRAKMAQEIGEDTEVVGYDGMIVLTRKLNSKHGSSRGTQEATIRILLTLFPSWLLPLFKKLIAKPAPVIAARMNAWVTMLSCQWLMGPSSVNDVEVEETGAVLPGQGVKIERCRYLEEAGCISVCLNSCKVPTQEFFKEEMGLDLRMTPNYEDFSCQFAFGLAPLPVGEDDGFRRPCVGQCPSQAGCEKLPAVCPGSIPSP